MKARDILASTRPLQGLCMGVRASAAGTAMPLATVDGNVVYRGRCMNPPKRFGRLAHVEDPTTPGEGDA